MRAFVTLMLSFVLLAGAEVRAQEALTMATPSGKPLVWDPEFTIPNHDPETEVVAFRLLAFEVDSADMPFFVDRSGIVVPKAGAEAALLVLAEDAQYAVLMCSFPGPGPFNLATPEVRARYCVIRRAERQP